MLILPTRKSIRNLTTMHIIRPDKEKNLTYVIPEDAFGENSQYRDELNSKFLGMDESKGPGRNSFFNRSKENAN
jgi:hypothetical protein